MKKDIENSSDIRKLVAVFHEKLLHDKEFEHIFLEVVKVDMVRHLAVVTDFWESALLQAGKYHRNTLDLHLEVHFQYRLNGSHFNRWLLLFNETVDELFAGKKAKDAKDKALSMAMIIKMKIDNLEERRLALNN